jgi:ketosteroid isomerase-like protein
MIEQDNIALLRGAYRCWIDSNGNDIGCWTRLMADRVFFGSLGAGEAGIEYTRHRSDKAGVARYLEDMRATLDIVSMNMGEFIAEGSRVVALGIVEYRNRATGKTFTTPKADVWRIENDRIVEFFGFYDTHKMIASTKR